MVMGKAKEHPAEQCGAIFYLHKCGDSHQKITKTIGCGHTTVGDMLKHYAETGSTNCISATVKHSPSCMHWGCFSQQGVGPIVPLHGSVTRSIHVQILHKYAMP